MVITLRLSKLYNKHVIKVQKKNKKHLEHDIYGELLDASDSMPDTENIRRRIHELEQLLFPRRITNSGVRLNRSGYDTIREFLVWS